MFRLSNKYARGHDGAARIDVRAAYYSSQFALLEKVQSHSSMRISKIRFVCILGTRNRHDCTPAAVGDSCVSGLGRLGDHSTNFLENGVESRSVKVSLTHALERDAKITIFFSARRYFFRHSDFCAAPLVSLPIHKLPAASLPIFCSIQLRILWPDNQPKRLLATFLHPQRKV